MRFHDWLRTRSIANRMRCATACKVTLGHLWGVAEKKYRASPQLTLRIERFTVGAVTRHDLRPDIYPRAGCACEDCTLHRMGANLEDDDAVA